MCADTGKNSANWYDGFPYRVAFNPVNRFAGTVARMIEPGSTLIDIGCATGNNAFGLSAHCRQVTGVDLSKRMIDEADRQRARRNVKGECRNVSFMNCDAAALGEKGIRFDYAMIAFMLHEVTGAHRRAVIESAFICAPSVIIIDYVSPLPAGLLGRFMVFVEFLTGREHYTNFKNFIASGGVDGLVREAGATVVEESCFSSGIGKAAKIRRP